MSIEEVARELYGLAPEEFTSARNARAKEAKAAGDADLAAGVQALRKPTTGAWLLNQLVRRHGEEVLQVLELGGRLRSAQGTIGAEELRALDRQRRQLTHAVASQAAALGREAGRRVSEQVTTEVEETLRSAMVDPAAGEALATGLLTDTFSSTGIEPVDLRGVVALGTPPAPRRTATPTARRTPADSAPAQAEAPDTHREEELADARKAVTAAESALEAAHELSRRAGDHLTQVKSERERLDAEQEEARRRLAELDEELSEAVTSEQAATAAREEAERQERAAAEEAARARTRVAELGAGDPGR